MAALGEFAFIETMLRPHAGEGALDLLDDAAVIDPPQGCQIVITKDALVADVHFLANDPPSACASKAIRVNLSDLAAMGAEPLGCILAIARPPSIDDAWLEAFALAFGADLKRFGCPLLGGDTVSTPGPLMLSVTALGTVPRGTALLRGGAKPGDLVVVSGTLGEGLLGLRHLQGDLDAEPLLAQRLAERYRSPTPRLALGARLRGLATACIDISDGLLADLQHLLDVSSVGAIIEADGLPIHPLVRPLAEARDAALSGGDDYELLFTVPAGARASIDRLADELGLPLTVIGSITLERSLRIRDVAGDPLTPPNAGWTHF
ncbi:MAG: thiamine-phosphate kinase [Geminicoccaceae bacterium]